VLSSSAVSSAPAEAPQRSVAELSKQFENTAADTRGLQALLAKKGAKGAEPLEESSSAQPPALYAKGAEPFEESPSATPPALSAKGAEPCEESPSAQASMQPPTGIQHGAIPPSGAGLPAPFPLLHRWACVVSKVLEERRCTCLRGHTLAASGGEHNNDLCCEFCDSDSVIMHCGICGFGLCYTCLGGHLPSDDEVPSVDDG
jgi:hypothetical protein